MTSIKRYLQAVVIAWFMAGAAPDAAAADPEARAREHYDRAVKLFSDRDYAAALAELQRAGELRPSYKLFHSIAQVHVAMNEPALALEAYRKYLEQGGQKIAPERRQQVADEMAALSRRVATPNAGEDVPGERAQAGDARVGAPQAASAVTDGGGSGAPVGESHRGTLASTEPLPAASERDDGSSRWDYAWLGWVATGTLVTGAAATGLWALSSESTLRSEREDANTPGGPSRARLESSASNVRALASVTDALWITAAAAGCVSLWLTLGPSEDERPAESAGRPLSLGVGSSGVSLQGSF